MKKIKKNKSSGFEDTKNQHQLLISLLKGKISSNYYDKRADPKGYWYIYMGLCFGFFSGGMLIFGVFTLFQDSDIEIYFNMLVFLVFFVISILSVYAGYKLLTKPKKSKRIKKG